MRNIYFLDVSNKFIHINRSYLFYSLLVNFSGVMPHVMRGINREAMRNNYLPEVTKFLSETFYRKNIPAEIIP
ncbi:hypothetical protein [Rahnella aquatilis]|uniref:hypothetical protein n=1 Tax=Rahnella aquatilis TaxID=34038 RepID=UPI0012E01501|nr:hypothetical protein [Rahnella aquatilis]